MSNLRGIYAEEEFNINNGVVVDTEPKPIKTNADDLKEPENIKEPDLIAAEQMIELQDELLRTGKELTKLLQYLKHDKIEQITYKEAKIWIATLKSNPAKGMPAPAKAKSAQRPIKPAAAQDVIEGEIVEEMPPKEPKTGLEKLRQTAQGLKNRQGVKTPTATAKAQENGFVYLPEDVCKFVNKLEDQYKTVPASLTMDELQLLDDANSGKFKGKEAYQINWDI
jgi:hypothetical protein